MAFWKISNVAIKGVAACVPPRILKTSDISLFNEVEAQVFANKVGIEERHVVDPGVCASDLCYTAAEKLITDLEWDKSEIEALIFVSVTPDYRSPATSCILQDRLGLPKECFTMDISLACMGYLHGLTVLSNLMSSGNIKKALLLVGDTVSVTSSIEDKSRFPLFGDAGTATALAFEPEVDDMFSYSFTDGSFHQAVITPHSGFRYPITPASFIMQEFEDGVKRAPVHGAIEGMDTFSFAINNMPKAVQRLCEKYNIDKENDVDYFLFHQANMMINRKVSKKLNLSNDKTPSNIKHYGNTSCAAIPLLMVTNIREKLQHEKLSLLLCAFCAGFTLGSMFVRTEHLVCPELMIFK